MNSETPPRWRAARPDDDDAIVAMCLALNREDPGPDPVGPDHARRTLDVLRREPIRGRAVVLSAAGHVAGYALLIRFWSNEHGGEVCEVDELFVEPAWRGRGHGSALFAAIEDGTLWSPRPSAIELGVTAANHRARSLYERLGFTAIGTSMARILGARS